MEIYRTLCFKTEKKAIQNKFNIDSYFANKLINSEIKYGIDERNNKGFYVEYKLKQQ